jgi:hypothetical protein
MSDENDTKALTEAVKEQAIKDDSKGGKNNKKNKKKNKGNKGGNNASQVEENK